MKRSELIRRLEQDGHTNARPALDAITRTVCEALRAGESVTIAGFGVFEPRPHGELLAVNPRRRAEVVYVPPKVAVGFRPSRRLTAKINGPN